MNVDFTGKVALVTGASSGIGKATALRFAQLGASVALVGRHADSLAAVVNQCRQGDQQKILAIAADVSTDAGCEKIAKEVIEQFGRLDVLVNNAGVGALNTLVDADMETFDRMFNLNVRGVYNLTRLLVHELIKTKGNIVNITSIIRMVSVGTLATDMTKAALEHFTRLTALELAPKGVRVNNVAPGATATEGMARDVVSMGADLDKFLKQFAAAVPMGKMCTGDDIARVVAFLASEHCALVTGTSLQVDGAIQYSGYGEMLNN